MGRRLSLAPSRVAKRRPRSARWQRLASAGLAGLAVTTVTTLAGVGAVVLSSTPAAAASCTDTWINLASSDFADATSQSTGVVPGPSDNACITAGGTYTVTAEGFHVASLTLGQAGNTGTQTLELDATPSSSVSGQAGAITIAPSGALGETGAAGAGNNDAVLDVASGTLDNEGLLEAAPAGG